MSSLLAAARTRRESGFTLIELLTVIVIIGILAAIAIPVFTSQRGRAADAAAVSEARSLVTAVESLAAGTQSGVLTAAPTAQALVDEGATSKFDSVAANAAKDNLQSVVSFKTAGYTVTTVTTNGKATKTTTASADTAANKNTAAASPAGNTAVFDRTTGGSYSGTASDVVLGF